jgi:hypothetical protein
MTKQIRLTSLALVSAVGLGFVAPQAAEAGKEGRRNTALALGAIAAYGIVKKKPAIAGIAGAGAVYSWISSNNVKERRHRRYRRARYNDRYYYDRPRYRRAYYDDDAHYYSRGRKYRSSYRHVDYGRGHGKRHGKGHRHHRHCGH